MSQTTRRAGYQAALTMPAPVILENNPQAPAAPAEALAGASALTLIADDLANVKAYALTSIPDNWQNSEVLTAIHIGSSVTSIGAEAFQFCTGLSGPLTIPAGVTSIGSAAFQGCTGLSGPLTIPESVTSIGELAFQGCTGLSGPLTIPESVTSIGDIAFQGCTGLSGPLTIPESVTSIGDLAFQECTGLSGTLTIPAGVTSIGGYAFNYITGIDTANIYTTTTVINENGSLTGSSISTIHARASDATWANGSGQTIGGKSGITVIKDL